MLALPHHDGSELYVPERADALARNTPVLLRVPRAYAVDNGAARFVRDGEPGVVPARIDRTDERETWWRASFPVGNPATPYRWLLAGGNAGYAWLNGVGLQQFDPPDADDFVATIVDDGPAWHLESVVYQVFPDRFASAGLDVEAPSWAVPREWDDLPTGRGPETAVEWFGGDLVGLERQLEHVAELGANVVYLTPVFPAGSTHRYDARSLDEVDPLLGGDDSLPTGYECWWGVPTLPKLNYGSHALRERMYEGAPSVVRRWLEPPFALDGWRIDVANMTGRRREVDLLPEVSRGVRSAALAARPDALVVAEHAH